MLVLGTPSPYDDSLEKKSSMPKAQGKPEASTRKWASAGRTPWVRGVLRRPLANWVRSVGGRGAFSCERSVATQTLHLREEPRW